MRLTVSVSCVSRYRILFPDQFKGSKPSYFLWLGGFTQHNKQ